MFATKHRKHILPKVYRSVIYKYAHADIIDTDTVHDWYYVYVTGF